MRLASIIIACWMPLAGLAVSSVVAVEPTMAQIPPPMVSDPTPRNTGTEEASWVLPGDFSEQTTLADLQARFGAANVHVVEATDSGGKPERSVVLFPNDPTRRAYLGFHDSVSLLGLAGISIRDVDSRWRGKHGVRVGMSLAQLRAINGKPFYLSGFDADNRGWVRDQWSPSLDDADDTLGKLDVEAGDRMYLGVELGLRGDMHASDPAAVDAFPKDDMVSSDDPRYPRLGELFEVTEISAYTSLDDEW